MGIGTSPSRPPLGNLPEAQTQSPTNLSLGGTKARIRTRIRRSSFKLRTKRSYFYLIFLLFLINHKVESISLHNDGVWSNFLSNTTESESLPDQGEQDHPPIINYRQTRKTEYDFTFSDHDLVLDSNPRRTTGSCNCLNSTTDVLQIEIECTCSGPRIEKLDPNVQRLTIERTQDFMSLSNQDILPYASTLTELVLSELPQFKDIGADTFRGMKSLKTIYIHETPSLREIEMDVFKVYLPKLKIIRITYTGLQTVPNLSQLHVQVGEALHMVELENGQIAKMIPGSFANLKTEHLSLGYNNLVEIGPWAFNGSTVAKLGLNGNRKLTTLHPEAFLGIQFLRVLDLSETSITYLPTKGLQELEELRLKNVWTLSVIPSIYNFQSLRIANLTWPYHCCAFHNPDTHDPIAFSAYQDYVRSTVQQHCANAAAKTITTTSSSKSSLNEDGSSLGLGLDINSSKTKIKRRTTRDSVPFDPTILKDPQVNPWESGAFGSESESQFDEEEGIFHSEVDPSSNNVVTLCGNVSLKRAPKVKCDPEPDAFNPCEDIMGSLWLRGAVWVVVALALVGNTAVLVVLLLAPGRMSVQRFLMANLSWADLSMGLYLLMVATQDVISLGSYFNYAIDWQLGWGCQIAGFLTVFASELSVFTLVVITGERWYALTRAIHLTKRLTIVGATQLMSLGWVLSMLLAGLPLLGVSSYSKTSICLPMEANSTGSRVYLAFLLLFNGLAFLLVATAYWQMYRAVAGHGGVSLPGASSADTAIAKKMALLVFTDFACWAPVAFFGLTAVGGYPLIGVTDSKILLVFFYPLNSTLNPYLYAIMTKQYRRDLLLLLSRHGICTKRAARYKAGGVSTNNTMQTMQTVLRLGSLTETKNILHPSSSPNGGPNVVAVDVKTNNMKSSCISNNLFDHPLLPPSPKESEEDHENSVSGRLLAETSFITLPSTFKSKLPTTVPEEEQPEHVTETTPFMTQTQS